ncbi:MAG TPA: family 16 glycosylhydrolase [Paracoccaceae bacterium]|nr:family 16 glycosylhydrolase [Paracoccaceae bacterium]
MPRLTSQTLATAFIACLAFTGVAAAESPAALVGQGWELVWNDEFDGEAIDPTKWSWETNCWGGGNNELQCYTDRSDNSFLRDGKLVIRAQKEDFTGPAEPLDWNSGAGDRTLPYTSARLRTLNKGDWTYGRFEIRAKLPGGQGIWPAIWMLPSDWVYGAWAASGEMDILEAVNLTDEADKIVHGTLHYGREWPANVQSGASYDFGEVDPRETFHTYAVEWGKREIRWYVDDVHYATQKSSGWYSQVLGDDGFFQDVPGDAPFDQRFHLLLNIAVGGNWPGPPDETTQLPVEFEIDHVRVFQCVDDPQTLNACATRDRSATRVFGNVAPEILRVEYDPNVLNAEVVTLFGDEDLSPFALGQYVANGTVGMARVEEEGRGLVTELRFETDESVVYWQAPFGFDLSAFDRIEFDVKVVADPRDDGGLMMKMDCFYPCGTGDFPIEPAEIGEWKSFSIPLADLVSNPGSSLDLSNVNTPLVIFPNWGNQKGVVLRVDDLRLVR